MGIVGNASSNYTSYFFDDVMKTPLEIGLIFGTWTLFEIPVMLFSKKLIDLFGNRWLIILGLVFNGIRLVLFSFFTLGTPFFYKWAASLIQGPAFGFSHIGIIDFVDRRAHADMRATYMSIMNIARLSISSALGGILGSWMIKEWSASFLMQFCGYSSFALVLFFFVFVKGFKPEKKRIC
jgi:MFS family permease